MNLLYRGEEDEARYVRLIRDIAKGSIASFESLYKDFVKIVYSYLKTQIDNEEIINDILHETFLAVWRNSKEFKGNSKVCTWIIGIARNKLISFLRTKYRRKAEEFDVEIDKIPAGNDFTESLCNKVSVQKALELLPKSSKELVYLVFNLDMSYKDISIILEIPEGTVKSRMHKIKNKLKEIIKAGDDCFEM